MKNADQRTEHIAHLAAQFLNRESNRTSLITVTRAILSDTGTSCTIFVSVLPVSGEPAAKIFLMRMAGPLKQYLMHEGGVQRAPHIMFEIDAGEKNRVRIEELSKQVSFQNKAMPNMANAAPHER